MLMANFLRNRKSVREFRNKNINERTLQEIEQCIENILEEAEGMNINFTLYKDGSKVYNQLKGVGGYAGIMINSPHYIGIEFNDEKDKTAIYGAYYTEKLVTCINDMGIEACWLTMTHVDDSKRKEAFGETGRQTDYVLAVGYPPLKNPFEILSQKIRGNEGGDTYLSAMGHSELKGETGRFATTSGTRLGIEKIVFKDELENPASVAELENIGLYELFYYVRFAPSNRNIQPWRFLIQDGKVKLLMAYSDEIGYSMVDAGVMMYYFEAMMKTGHYLGTGSTWELIEGECEGKNAKYKYVAEFKI